MDVTASGAGGTSATSEADHYTYSAPLVTATSPVVESVSPNSGPVSGGTVVTIKGSHLSGAFSVQFGGTSSTQVTPISASEVQAVAPAAAYSMRADVTVTTSVGSSAPTLTDGFDYGSPPAPVATGVTLTPSASSSPLGQAITLKAVVAPSDGGGSIAFYTDGSSTPLSNCGTQTLTMNGGAYEATCSTSSLAIGGHSLSATYSGDASYAGSSGATSVTVTHTAEEEAKAKAEAEAKKKAEEATAKAKAKAEAEAKKKQEEERNKKSSTKPPTRAQLLAKALKACKKQPKKKRAKCEAAARKKYGKPKPKKSIKRKGKHGR